MGRGITREEEVEDDGGVEGGTASGGGTAAIEVAKDATTVALVQYYPQISKAVALSSVLFQEVRDILNIATGKGVDVAPEENNGVNIEDGESNGQNLEVEDDAKKAGMPRENHQVFENCRKLPRDGQPANSSADLLNPDGSVKQRRYYDAEGKAELDIDYNHTDDGTHEFPHRHQWDWNKIPPRIDSRR